MDSTQLHILKAAGVGGTFVGLAIVCDEYFVPSLELIAERWKISPNVAGATLMAAGGSMPELFTALVATQQRSIVGFSAVVGSAVFNVLFVIGVCIFAQKEPMKLTPWPLARDCICYTIGLVTLTVFFTVVSPAQIEWWEAAVLLCEYLAYVALMKYDGKLQEWAAKKGYIQAQSSCDAVTFRAGVLKWLEGNPDSDQAISFRIVAKAHSDVDATFKALDKDQNGTLDRAEVAQMVKELSGRVDESAQAGLFETMDIDGDGVVSLEEFKKWYLGSKARLEDAAHRAFELEAGNNETISRKQVSAVMVRLGSRRRVSRTASRNDCENPIAYTQTTRALATMAKETAMAHACTQLADASERDLELGVDSKSNDRVTFEAFLNWYKSTLTWETNCAMASLEADEGEPGVSLKPPGGLGNLAWLVTIPLRIGFALTIPDVQQPQVAAGKHCYFAFLTSVLWIGVLSYWMVLWAEDVGAWVGIPDNVMGLTILAAGTSVPDLISSAIVARQGEGDMAISSSIGSNIFDILVGLPVAWLTFSLYRGEAIDVQADSLEISLPILIVMLVLLVGTIHLGDWTTKRYMGGLFILMYGAFVAQDLMRSDW